MNLSAYGNGAAPRSELTFFEGMWLSDDLLRRMKFVFTYVRSKGQTISGTEGYRWKGVPNDRRVTEASRTSDGTSNQWFQKGRQDRGLTPAAAYPGTSRHGEGESVDTSCSSVSVRDDALYLAGMGRDVPSESWHASVLANPRVDIDNYFKSSTPPVPKPEENEDDMADRGELLNFRETKDLGKTLTGSLFFRSPTRGIMGIRNPYDLTLLKRYLAISATNPEVMLSAETAILNYYLVAPTPGTTVIDTSALTKTVQDALAKLGKDLAVSTDLSDDDVTAISRAVNDEFAKRIKS